MNRWTQLLLLTGCALIPGCVDSTAPGTRFSLEAPPVQSTYKPGPRVQDGEKVILFLGDSLTAGYGIDVEKAFPSLIQQKIDELGWDYKVVNAGISGDTSSSGVRRVDWLLNHQVEVLFLELGANDGLRGISLALTRKNLQNIIDRVRLHYPQAKVVIAGMMVPPNMGPDYSSGFQKIFSELAEKNNATLIPFLLEGVAGKPELNLDDGIHPTEEGHQIVASLVWKYLKPVLEPPEG